MPALRLKGGGFFATDLDPAGSPGSGVSCKLGEKSGFMCNVRIEDGPPGKLDLDGQQSRQASLTPKNPPGGADDQNQAYG